jgi:hypothetical protein
VPDKLPPATQEQLHSVEVDMLVMTLQSYTDMKVNLPYSEFGQVWGEAKPDGQLAGWA